MNRFKSIYMYVYLLILLILLDIELSCKGFNNTFKKYTLKYFVIKEVIWDNATLKKIINEIEQVFCMLDIVCAWYPRKADCIHKTLLGYRIIRGKYAIPVDMVVGIRKFPFEAHAWLQCMNCNVFNDEEETSKYKIILRSSDLIEGD